MQISWLIAPYSQEAKSLSQAIAVMKLSRQWGSPSGEHWAKTNLRALCKATTIPPALRLRIGRLYMNEWVHSALSELVSHPLKWMKARDVEWLGFPLYVYVSRVREKHDETRRKLAMCAPRISEDKGDDCTNHTQCIRAWEYAWFQTIGKPLLHPEHLMALQFWQVEDRIAEMDTSQMAQGCGRKAKAKALGPGVVAQADYAFIERAVEVLAENIEVESLEGVALTWETRNVL